MADPLETALAALSDARTALLAVVAAEPAESEQRAWALDAWSALRRIEERGEVAKSLDAKTGMEAA